MDSDATAADLVTVHHQVVCLGLHFIWITFEKWQILIAGRCERVVQCDPALLFFVPHKRGEIDDPQQVQMLGPKLERSWRAFLFLGGLLFGLVPFRLLVPPVPIELQCGAKITANRPERLVYHRFLVGDDKDQVAGLHAQSLLERLLGRIGEKLLNWSGEFVPLVFEPGQSFRLVKIGQLGQIAILERGIGKLAGSTFALSARTTPPSASALLKTANSLSAAMSAMSTISMPKRRSGLSEPYLAIASA